MSDQGCNFVGHWQILVGYCPMTDSYLQPCISTRRTGRVRSSCAYAYAYAYAYVVRVLTAFHACAYAQVKISLKRTFALEWVSILCADNNFPQSSLCTEI